MQALYTCPAYDVIEGPVEPFGADPVVMLVAGDELADADRPMNHYQIGSVVSSCLKDRRCPIQGLERAKGHGHALHFIFALGSSITAWKQARKTYIGVRVGQVVAFEGRRFEITKQPNNNLGLKEVG